MFSVRLAVTNCMGDVFDGVLRILCCPLSYEMSWIRSGIEMSQFLKIFLSISASPENFPVYFCYSLTSYTLAYLG